MILIYAAAVILFAAKVVPIFNPLALAFCLGIYFIFTTATHEDMNNGHILINSLPVDRKEVVTAKYAFHIAVGVGFIALDILLEAVTGARLPDIAWQFAVAALGIVWFVSVFFPLYFWLDHRFVRVAMVILFVMIVGAVPIMYNLGVKHNFWGLIDAAKSLPGSLLFGLAAAVTVLVLAVSWLLSVRLYERKQF